MNTFTLLIAAYGALVSTWAILWQVKVWRDRARGRVKVSVSDNMMTYSQVEGQQGPFIVFEAVNDGEKPVIISAILVTVRGGRSSFWLKNLQLPMRLNEGEKITHLTDRKELLVKLGSLGLEPPWKCQVVFQSTAARKYKKRFLISG